MSSDRRRSRLQRNTGPRPTLRLAVVMALGLVSARDAAGQAVSANGNATLAPEMREAREHFNRGIALFEHGDHEGALAEFLRAQTLSGRPGMWFNIGASYQALHRYPEAVDALRRYLAEAPRANPRQRADAERSLREIEALIAHLRVVIEPADARFSVDDRPAQSGALIDVGPGRHRIEASKDGYHSEQQEVVIASGETREIAIALRVIPPPPPPVSAAPATPAVAVLEVTGIAPDATLEVDGAQYPASAPVVLPPGRYSALIRAPRMRPWRGQITLAAGAPRTLRVSLVPEGPQTPPAYFWTAVATCGGLATTAAIFGSAALATHADYITRHVNDPEADAVANRGRAFAAVADATGLAAIFAGAVASYLLLRTEFVPRSSSAVLAVHPVPGGMGITGRIGF